jgi:hypothetical protein
MTKPGGTVLIANHFSVESGLRGIVEKKMSKHAAKLGWRPEFPVDSVLVSDKLRLVSLKQLKPWGFFTLMEFVRVDGWALQVYYIFLGVRYLKMALSIKNSIVEEKARELAQRSGKSITDALNDSLDLALQRQRSFQQLTKKEELFAKVKDIQKRVAALPVLDHRTDDEILGYNEHGHFD